MPRAKAPKTTSEICSGEDPSSCCAEAQRPPRTLRLHQASELVPELAGAEYEALRADVGERGLLIPLEITSRGIVLDGRARLRAARELGLEHVPVRIVSPPDEIRHLVLAALLRRHLSASQRACLAVELEDYEQSKLEGRKRQLANLKGQPEVAALPPRGERTRERAAKRAGVSARSVQDAATVKEADPVLFAAIKRDELSVEKAAHVVRRQRKLAALPPAPALPAGPFELLYADPPWSFGTPDSAFAPENHYPTMAFEEITALQPPAAADALLFLWAVSSLLPQALEVLAAWGFSYKTSLVWVKPSIGLGRWVRHRHELLLVGCKGGFSVPDPQDRPDSVIEAPRGRHSQKPECVYALLERMYPAASRLELFARGAPRPGWAAWGNEVEAA